MAAEQNHGLGMLLHEGGEEFHGPVRNVPDAVAVQISTLVFIQGVAGKEVAVVGAGVIGYIKRVPFEAIAFEAVRVAIGHDAEGPTIGAEQVIRQQDMAAALLEHGHGIAHEAVSLDAAARNRFEQ